jgi:hypothetical protein
MKAEATVDPTWRKEILCELEVAQVDTECC